MVKWLIRRKLASFERAYQYDMSYAREILDIDLGALLAFAKIQKLTEYRRDVPVDVYYAVKLVGTMTEDCGPCTQLTVTMALRDGVAGSTLAAVIAGDDIVLPEPVQLGVRFARAALAHDLATEPLRDDMVRRWGKRALVSLSYALVAARIYPTLKYALGHGKACTRIVVGGEQLVPKRSEQRELPARPAEA